MTLVVAIGVAVHQRHRRLGRRHPGRLGLGDRRIRLVDRAGERRHDRLGVVLSDPLAVALGDQPHRRDDDAARGGACAGIMPIMHLGRQGFFYWLFPYPNVMGVWPQVRSPLWWDFICLLCYILMSIMYYYAGLLPGSRHGAGSGAASPQADLLRHSGARLARLRRATGATIKASICIMCGDHGADGDLGAQRRRPRFRRRADHRLALHAVPALLLLWRGHLRARADHHADDHGAPWLRSPGHHYRAIISMPWPRSC